MRELESTPISADERHRYEQFGSPLSLFADRYVARTLGHNPVVILIFAPVLAILWKGLSEKDREPSAPMKAHAECDSQAR
jgi:dipeptide/tripeptide permease